MIVVGGGASTRFGQDKLMAEVAGRRLIEHTVDAVVDHVDVCVVVCRAEIAEDVAALSPDVTVTRGGTTRTLSEMAGLAAIGQDVDLIGIHDAARPLVTASTVELLFETAEAEGGALPLLGYDKLILDKRTHEPIAGVHGAQTPQVFRAPELMAAYVAAARKGFDAHDTVEVVQRFSDVRIVGVEGDPANLKVTFPSDLDEVRILLSGPSRT
jgi:2-C-methyl-D-erythritol 4-phosphate cytidylyltransferase